MACPAPVRVSPAIPVDADWAIANSGAANKAITPDKYRRFFGWFERLGPRALIFGWVPAIGDPLCTVAGWLKMPFWPCVGWMTLGKFLRYTVFTALLLWVPDAWWMTLLRPFLG